MRVPADDPGRLGKPLPAGTCRLVGQWDFMPDVHRNSPRLYASAARTVAGGIFHVHVRAGSSAKAD